MNHPQQDLYKRYHRKLRLRHQYQPQQQQSTGSVEQDGSSNKFVEARTHRQLNKNWSSSSLSSHEDDAIEELNQKQITDNKNNHYSNEDDEEKDRKSLSQDSDDRSISDGSIGIPMTAMSNNQDEDDEDNNADGIVCPTDQHRRVSTPAAICAMSTATSNKNVLCLDDFDASRCIWRRAATTIYDGKLTSGCVVADSKALHDLDPSKRFKGDKKLERLITPTRRSCSEADQKQTSKMESSPTLTLRPSYKPDMEAMMIESWLDDHPTFTRDYFLRKASRQFIDEWLICHATKVSSSSTMLNSCNEINQMRVNRSSTTATPATRALNTPSLSNDTDSQLFEPPHQSEQKSPRPYLQMIEKQPRSADSVASPLNTNQSSIFGGSRSGVRQIRSNSQSGSRASISSRLDMQNVAPVRKISATDFESRTMNGYLRPMLSRTPDGRLTFLSQPTIDEPPFSSSPKTKYIRTLRNEAATPPTCTGNDAKQAFKSSDLVNSEQQIASDNRTSDLAKDSILDDLLENEKGKETQINHDNDPCDSAADSDYSESVGEIKMIFELVKNICDDLDIKTLLHKIMKNIAILINADKSSLSLVKGAPGDPHRHLVTQLFNVDQDDKIEEPKHHNEEDSRSQVSSINDLNDDERDDYITIPWGTGLVGYVAQSGEFLNIADCYKDPRFTDAIDQHTGYLTRHMLCAPIYDKKNDIVGVAQVINKRDGQPFTKSDEIKFKRYLQFCGIGLRNAQSYEHCQLENRRNQVLLDLARMVFEEQSSVEQMVYRIMLHTQSLLECQRCQVLLIDDGSEDLEQLLQPQINASTGFCCTNKSNDETSRSTNSQTNSTSNVPTTNQYIDDDTGSASKGETNYPSKLFSLVFDLECDSCEQENDSCDNISESVMHLSDLNTGEMYRATRTKPFPINIGITGFVAMTGETLNIEDAHKDPRFDPTVDENSTFRHKSILCMPIRNGQRKIIGVSQLVNKKNGRAFNKNDEDILEAFAIFCGLGIHNTLMYERVLKIMAKQRVTFEVLSYHATAPLEEAKKLNQEQIPSCYALNLASLKFNDFSLDDQYMLKSCLRFFLDLDLMRRFQIDQLVFCNWILSVQKNYRKVTYHPIVGGSGLKASPVRYHNWRHAFNVSQMMFSILVNTQMNRSLGELETLALLIACLCHDLDHRGTNNSFQIKSASPLAKLYSTSTMEHHHFDQCVMILNSQGNQILANLSPEEYSRVIVLLEEAILATDLANYFQKRDLFFQLVNSNQFDWCSNQSHRSLLRCMLMTACDVAAITKPWPVQKVVADLVMSEFYHQGDIERNELNIEPIDMMNRDKMSKLPEMQLSFIDTICAPIYSAFAKLFPHELNSLLDGCLTNRTLWTDLKQKTTTTAIQNFNADDKQLDESLQNNDDCYRNNNLSTTTTNKVDNTSRDLLLDVEKESQHSVSKSVNHLNHLLDEAIDDTLDQQVDALSDSNTRSPELLFSAINLDMCRAAAKADSCQRKSV